MGRVWRGQDQLLDREVAVKEVDLWNTATKSIAATVTDPGGQGVNSLNSAPDGTLVISDDNSHTYLWKITRR